MAVARLSGYAIAFGIFLISLGYSSIRGGRWEESNPSKLGFKWGYFFVANTFLNNILILAVIAFILTQEGEPGIALPLLGLGVLQTSVAYHSVKRNRVALIGMTILSFNPLWMVINAIYLKNRWSEFREEMPDAGAGSRFANVTSIEKVWRMAGFLAFFWFISVPAFVYLARPYGRMYDEDYTHMIAVMIVPPLIGVLLLWVYRRFVK